MLSKSQIKLVRSLEMKKNRQRESLFVAEGPKVVGDLLRAGYVVRQMFSTTGGDNAQTVTEDELRRLSFLRHPQEVLAVFEIPGPAGSAEYVSGLCLALDGVQDPGNVGTIIRIADWFGIDAIYCSHETADVYNPKVVQATMGSLAHIPVIYGDLTRLLSHAGCPVYGTLLDGEDIYSQRLSREGIIVMGNEGNGISEGVRRLITNRLLIPNFNSAGETAESLNVAIATAVTCSEFRRRG